MTKIAFIGAGSVVFTRQLLTDLLRFDDLGEVEFALHDIDGERLAVARGVAEQLLAQRGGTTARLSSSLDRRQVLAGADFVVNMIQVGGIAATRRDHEIPARYGLRQTIGDTTGVGGVSRALRTFPVLTAITADMRELCPDALLLNYTNPMAMNVWWASTIAPDIRTYGLCHSVYWTAADLCDLVDVPLEGTHYRAAGLNHQSWLLEWSRDGKDLYPLLRERIENDPELRRRVRVEMFRRVGYYPTETSEHSSEYLSWFLRSDAQVEQFRLVPSEYIGISEENVREFEQARLALAEGREIAGHGEDEASEYAPQIIHSIVTDTRREVHVNIPNDGYITNLPGGAAVEVPAVVDAAGVRPLAMGALPPQCIAVNRPYLSVAELTVDAMREGDPVRVRQAMLADPNASSTLTPEQIWELADELLASHGDLVPAALRRIGGGQ